MAKVLGDILEQLNGSMWIWVGGFFKKTSRQAEFYSTTS
jgi:hypothetical protein